MEEIKIRPATIDDVEIVFKWRNDPFIVARASSQRLVQWDEHQEWFRKSVGAHNRRIFIVQNSYQPIGQVRFDRLNESQCTISVYLLQEFTGKGVGIRVICDACDLIFNIWPLKEIIACVRLDNLRAYSAFIKAGFIETRLKNSCPEAHFTFCLNK